MLHRIAAVVAAGVLLAGCGGSQYESADDVISAVQKVLPGCNNVKDTTGEWFVQEAKSCTYTQGGGRKDTVTASMFVTGKQQRNWVKMAEEWGQGFLVEGDGWVIGLRNRTNAEALGRAARRRTFARHDETLPPAVDSARLAASVKADPDLSDREHGNPLTCCDTCRADRISTCDPLTPRCKRGVRWCPPMYETAGQRGCGTSTDSDGRGRTGARGCILGYTRSGLTRQSVAARG
ncbi:hypothetical protein BH24DEI2_BH24DEI2_25420 [soil metagenome]